MTKSRNRKNHKQKLKARKTKIEQERKKVERMKREFIMDLIRKEQQNGAFDNTKSIDSLNTPVEGIDGPIIDLDI
jgi:hypothetical protein